MTDQVKRCECCKAYYPAGAFGLNRTKADGRASVCKPCARERQAQCQARKDARMHAWREARRLDNQRQMHGGRDAIAT